MITIGIDPGQTGGVSIVSNGQWIDGMRMALPRRGR